MSIFTAGQPVTADMMNGLERPVARFRRTTSLTGIDDSPEVEWGSVTLSAPRPNSEYEVRAKVRWFGGAAASVWVGRIREGSIAGTDRSGVVVDSLGAGPYWANWSYPFSTGASPSSITFVGGWIRAGGTGTVSVDANTILEIWLKGTTSEMTTA